MKEHNAMDLEQAFVKAYFTVSEEARRELMEKLYLAALDVHDAREPNYTPPYDEAEAFPDNVPDTQ